MTVLDYIISIVYTHRHILFSFSSILMKCKHNFKILHTAPLINSIVSHTQSATYCGYLVYKWWNICILTKTFFIQYYAQTLIVVAFNVCTSNCIIWLIYKFQYYCRNKMFNGIFCLLNKHLVQTKINSMKWIC